MEMDKNLTVMEEWMYAKGSIEYQDETESEIDGKGQSSHSSNNYE